MIRVSKMKILISFLIALAALTFLFLNINLEETLIVISKTNLSLYAFAFLLSYFGLVLRAKRWDYLLRNINFFGKLKDLFEIYFLSLFANCLLPAKLGDFYRGHLMKKNYNLSMSRTVGTIFVERIIDIILLVLFLSVSGMIVFGGRLPGNITAGLQLGYMLVVFLVVTLLMIGRWREQIIERLPEKVSEYFERFEEGCSQSLKSNRFKVIILSVSIWLVDIMRLFVVTKALGLDIPFDVVLFVLPAAALMTALPLTPAGLGAVELTITGILTLLGYDINVAASVAILERVIDYWSYILLGALLHLISRKV